MTMEEKKPYKFVVVGGGTAGWISALYLRYKSPSSEITLVESDSIGVLGAGEGTTPPFMHFLESVQIPLSRLVQETSTTIKNGIKFVNWQGAGDYYYHGFAASEEVGLSAFDNHQYLFDTSMLFAYGEATGKSFSDYNYIDRLCEQNKVPFHLHPEYESQAIPDPIFKYLYNANYAVHFDAIALADFFKKVATEEREIIRIEGKVVGETTNSGGEIESLQLESGESIEGDFFIDCTGFAKRLIGGLYESEWEDHSKYLTVDSAMPYFLPVDPNNLASYTESTAMKYGWSWKIPLQHRYGCGYVFDSKYLTDEEAKAEIIEFLGEEPVWPREKSFKFSPGYYKTPWTKNCLAVGLSSGFIEPLEATSIWATILQLKHALKDMALVKNRNQKSIDEFNNYSCRINNSIFNFVYLHYMGGRTDTEFWKHYQSDSNTPPRLKSILSTWEYRLPRYTDFEGDIFLLESWLSVAKGVSKVNDKTYKQLYEDNDIPEHIENDYKFLMQVQEEHLDIATPHGKFLADLGQASQVRQA